MDQMGFRPGSYEEGVRREWLVANGIGGYASSTAIGANTRSYHGLLVAALRPPGDRTLLLSSLDEEYSGLGLGNHQYPGAVHPQGFEHLEGFSLDPFPRFVYSAGEARIEKTVFPIHFENTTVVRYRVTGGSGVLGIVPLVNCRSFHSACDHPAISQEGVSGGVRLRSRCDLFLLSDRARYVQDEKTYYNFEYEEERRRGLSWRENLFSPGRFEVEVDGDTTFGICASGSRESMPDIDITLDDEAGRARGLDAPIERFAMAADSFVVRRDGGKSIIAGYHWFDDWGRDAMIAIHGLLLVNGRFDDARAVLSTFAGAMKDGLLPNDLGAGSYNTVDASLWFVQSVFSYLRRSGDAGFVRNIWQNLLSIFERYSREDGPGIRMDSDHLLSTGPALTWMDARVNEVPVTPRAGKACEINALWYSDLKGMESLAGILGEPWEIDIAGEVKRSFQKFWNPETECLYDVIDPADASIRPNQIIAAAVPDLLTPEQRRGVFDVVTAELLTPYGLRTLSPKDPKYRGRYGGGPAERDSAYHQGTVWPWLIGPYVTALLSINGYSERSRVRARSILHPLVSGAFTGMNTIPEVFDGDEPYAPGGCISQAWSVAEVLAAWWRASSDGPATENKP